MKHNIIELEDPTADADAVNSRTLNRNITKPSNHITDLHILWLLQQVFNNGKI